MARVLELDHRLWGEVPSNDAEQQSDTEGEQPRVELFNITQTSARRDPGVSSRTARR